MRNSVTTCFILLVLFFCFAGLLSIGPANRKQEAATADLSIVALQKEIKKIAYTQVHNRSVCTRLESTEEETIEEIDASLDPVVSLYLPQDAIIPGLAYSNAGRQRSRGRLNLP